MFTKFEISKCCSSSHTNLICVQLRWRATLQNFKSDRQNHVQHGEKGSMKNTRKKYQTVTLTLTLYSFFSWHRWKDAQKTSKIKKFKRQGFLLSTSRKFIHSPLPGKISPSRLPHQIFIPSPPKANSPPPPLNKNFV